MIRVYLHRRKYELLTSATLRSFGTLHEVCFALLRSASVGDGGDYDGNEAVVESDGSECDSKKNIEMWAKIQGMRKVNVNRQIVCFLVWQIACSQGT